MPDGNLGRYGDTAEYGKNQPRPNDAPGIRGATKAGISCDCARRSASVPRPVVAFVAISRGCPWCLNVDVRAGLRGLLHAGRMVVVRATSASGDPPSLEAY